MPEHTRSPPERIVLVGFMGSGKTSVGTELAALLRWSFLDRGTHPPQSVQKRRDTIALLDAQLFRSTNLEGASRDGPGDGQRGDLVDQRGHDVGWDVHTAQRRRSSDDGADRLRLQLRRGDLERSAHLSEHVEESRTPGVQRDTLDPNLGVGYEHGGHDQEGRARGVAGHRELSALEPRPTAERDPIGVALERNAECREQPFGVVAAPIRLADRRASFCLEPSQEHRRLHLRARHAELPVDAAKRSPLDAERGMAVG